ncbi:MAG: flavodoxin-dependent (E)-4-hydroxy-3-methylbut-2-enyl-diphosphate synthase [Clostridia bacterium]|nr:flavodoxin-dependent (E)-4-hydroxy-3-methylbut-2-enyl-diphosphate synthase [Clostridia bacterium]
MSKTVYVGGVPVGGKNRITVQTMATVKTERVDECAAELNGCVSAGADIVRVAVRDDSDAEALKTLSQSVTAPIVADIHFDYRLALKSIENGAAKIRINPGNIGGKREIKAVSERLKYYGIPVRVGSNSGSIEKEFLAKYGRSAEALAESALFSATRFEKFGVENIVLSAKASDVPTTVKAYEILSERCDYPLHIGVTEAGAAEYGVIKGAIGVGSLLLKGIGDTVRVSLTAPPAEEVRAALNILRAVGLDKNFAEVISCPTCGRCEYDVFGLSEKIRKATENVRKPIKIAVMGCVVNGIGEGKEADVGIAGGKDKCVIFRGGEPVRTVSIENAEPELMKEVELWLTKI